MRLLLDSHTLLWAVTDPGKMKLATRQYVEDLSNDVYVSAASLWELQIKAGKGKLTLPAGFSHAIPRLGFVQLPITFQHADAIRHLPLHHQDPFDRMLVAQAIVEGLTLVTRDGWIQRYPVPVLEV